MINPSQVTTTTTYNTAPSVSTLGGGLSLEEWQDRLIGRDENSNPRLLIVANGEDFRMKVSKPGKDATVAEGDDLIFDSNQNFFKITKSGEAEVIVPPTYLAQTYDVSIPHGSTSPPPHEVYLYHSPFATDFYTVMPLYTPLVDVRARVTSTDIVFTVAPMSAGSNPTIAGSWKFKYFIKSESIQP